MNRELKGEVADFVSQLGFHQISNKDVDDDFELQPDGEDFGETLSEEKSKTSTNKKKKKDTPAGSHKRSSDANKIKGPISDQKRDSLPSKALSDASKTAPDGKARKQKRRKRNTDAAAGDDADADAASPSRPRPSKRARSRDGSAAAEPAVQVQEVSSTAESGDGSTAEQAPEKRWYEVSVTEHPAGSGAPDSSAGQLTQEASQAMTRQVAAFKTDGGGRPAAQWTWMQTVLASGTVSDKLAARQTLLRARPEVNLHLMEDTCRMVAAKGKGHAMAAMGTLAELFGSYLLPPGRKLKQFRQQPLGALKAISGGDPVIRKQQLVLWLFEERLKKLYGEFVDRVKTMSHDTVEKTRKSGVNTLAQLLTAHPEMEQTLLETLVNKLGDEKKSVACLAVRRLSSLLRTHPAMRTVVVKEVERLLFRRNVGKRVQFYGICFLSQVQFSDEGDEALAERIVKIYIGFFRACVKQAELDARLMRALLTGLAGSVSRARLVGEQLQQYMQPLHHIAQLSSFGVATQALILMFRLSSEGATGAPSDRFYCALYKKLVHPGLATSQKVADFLNLVYRSVARDSCLPRARAFVKRLLQCCLHQTAALACSVLLLVSELFRRRPELAKVAAEAPAAAGWTADDDDDGEETPRDAALPEDAAAGSEPAPAPSSDGSALTPPAAPVRAGWVFVGGGGAPSGASRRQYDPLYREPRWCRAELAALHELERLQRHLHPSVALFASQLTTGQTVQYTGNPLHDFQLMNFLNRFCYKNPKKTGSSAEQAARALPVTSPKYAQLESAQVPHDERFFHRYFRWREEHGLTPSDTDASLTDARGDVTDQAFDQFLDGFFGKKAAKEVDFMSEIADHTEEALEGDGDEEEAAGGLEAGDSDDEDLESLGSFGDDDDNSDDDQRAPSESSGAASRRHGGNAKKGDVADLFASAEEFSEMLEENADTADGSSQALAGAGKTSREQLSWETSGSRKRRRPGTAADFRAGANKRKGPKEAARRKK